MACFEVASSISSRRERACCFATTTEGSGESSSSASTRSTPRATYSTEISWVACPIKVRLGFSPKGDVFKPETLPRQEGKAVRVVRKDG